MDNDSVTFFGDTLYIALPCPVDSMREAMLTVSPNRQYLGILSPTTAATHGPVHIHIITLSLAVTLLRSL